ncbi:hypothetical protein [Thalassoglobus sp.]
MLVVPVLVASEIYFRGFTGYWSRGRADIVSNNVIDDVNFLEFRTVYFLA